MRQTGMGPPRDWQLQVRCGGDRVQKETAQTIKADKDGTTISRLRSTWSELDTTEAAHHTRKKHVRSRPASQRGVAAALSPQEPGLAGPRRSRGHAHARASRHLPPAQPPLHCLGSGSDFWLLPLNVIWISHGSFGSQGFCR